MEDNKEKSTPKYKRILALVAVIIIVAVYIVGLVFAFLGKGYAIPVVMTCILIASYIAVYFHIGQLIVNLLKKKNKRIDQGEQKDE